MEAKITAMFMNAQLIMIYRMFLKDIGHPQPLTRIHTNNQSACDVLTGKMNQKRTKSVDMNFYWLNDCTVNHKQLKPKWGPGPTNLLGDYPTKHHTGTHHHNVRPVYLYIKDTSPSTLKGWCNKLLSPKSGISEACPVRKPTVSPTLLNSPIPVKKSTGTFNILDVARTVISESMHKHHLIII